MHQFSLKLHLFYNILSFLDCGTFFYEILTIKMITSGICGDVSMTKKEQFQKKEKKPHLYELQQHRSPNTAKTHTQAHHNSNKNTI